MKNTRWTLLCWTALWSAVIGLLVAIHSLRKDVDRLERLFQERLDKVKVYDWRKDRK